MQVRVYRYALALFAVNGLDHHRAMLVEKGQVIVGITGQLLRRHLQPGSAQGMLGQALVLAQGHGHGAGRVAERLSAADAPAAQAQGEQPAGGVIHLPSMPRRNASSTMMRA